MPKPPTRRPDGGGEESDLPQPFVQDALGVKDLLPHGAQLLHVCLQPDNKPALRKTAGARSQSEARSRSGGAPLPSFRIKVSAVKHRPELKTKKP